ncbi:MAG: MerR family transcriptional regulator [Gammaproteobacteria bacterium]|jgi:DNA-binding transcriptional MerR regulator|nr:MerR family transcriptional regulator [Gammaproteobacteria bacterium]
MPQINPQLPSIPTKRYFTISEASDLCEVEAHVLRYWEQEFSQLKPLKRRGNRRYYQRHDVILIRQIKDLLYNNGYTIKGAKQKLSDDENHEESQSSTLDAIRSEVENLIDILD